MSNLNGVAGDTVAQVTTYLLNRFNPVVDQMEEYYRVLKALTQGELTLDRVSLTEDRKVQILPERPKASTNGKEATKDVSPKATEQAEDEQPAVGVEATDG